MADTERAGGEGREHFPKLIYLARRNPRLTRAEFTPRWRQHGALGMSMPRWVNVLRYGHCDVICPQEPVAGISSEADGIGMIWYRDAAARARNIADTRSQKTMETDEDEVFAERVVKCGAVTKEVVVHPGPRTAFKLISFVKRAEGVDDDRLIDYSQNEYAPELLSQKLGTAEGIVRYVLNHAVRSDPQISSGLDVDLVEEMWFRSTADRLSAGAGFHEFTSGRGGRLVARRVNFLTNEIMLYEAKQ